MDELELFAARVHERRDALVDRPAVTPLSEAQEDGPQLVARLGQVVLETRRTLLVLALLQDAGGLEPTQPVREDVPRRAGSEGALFSISFLQRP